MFLLVSKTAGNSLTPILLRATCWQKSPSFVHVQPNNYILVSYVTVITVGRLEVSVHHIILMEVAHSSGYPSSPVHTQLYIWLAPVCLDVAVK